MKQKDNVGSSAKGASSKMPFLATFRKSTIAIAGDATVSRAVFKVYTCLAGHFNLQTGSAYPSIRTIVSITRLNERTVRRAVKTLQQNGYIEKVSGTGRGATSHYQLKCPDKSEAGVQKVGADDPGSNPGLQAVKVGDGSVEKEGLPHPPEQKAKKNSYRQDALPTVITSSVTHGFGINGRFKMPISSHAASPQHCAGEPTPAIESARGRASPASQGQVVGHGSAVSDRPEAGQGDELLA